MFKKILAFILAAFILTSLVACGNDTENSESTNNETPESIAGLPSLNFGGEEFYILSVGRANVCSDDFAYTEENGSILDAAIHKRNMSVEALYNVKLVTEWKNSTANQQSPEAYKAIQQQSRSGDALYDLCVVPGYDVSELAYNGNLADLNKLPYFDAAASWYDAKANETFDFGGSLFFTAGDYGINLMDQTYCIAFNKKLAEEYSIEDLYTLVENKQWTLEKMTEIAKKVASDSDGDGVTDIYGNLYWVDAVYGALNAAGQKLVTLDEDSLTYKLSANNETSNDVLRDFYDMVMDEKISLKYQHNSTNKEYVNIFSGDKALFFLTTIGTLGDFRNMETDYGILPYFLYSETQEEYANTVAPFYMNYMCVPLVVNSYERTSAIMEGIGYYSEQHIIPAYYEKTLTGQYVRDTESSKMLDIIFETRAYDLGYCYQPAWLNKHLIYMLNEGNFDWSSRYASLELSAQATLNLISMSYRNVIEQ